MVVGLSRGQASEVLECSPQILLVWERRGLIPKPQRRPGGWRVYTPEDIESIARHKAVMREVRQSYAKDTR